jgi:hypothetical protein
LARPFGELGNVDHHHRYPVISKTQSMAEDSIDVMKRVPQS